MKELNIFEVALRGRYRFDFKGVINTEDLWVLSTKDLDTIFKGLNAQLKQVKEESLLKLRTTQDKEIETKVEIIKYIVQVKLEEEQLKVNLKEQKIKKQKIMELLSAKQDNALQNKSEEELQKMLDELDS